MVKIEIYFMVFSKFENKMFQFFKLELLNFKPNFYKIT